MMSRQRNLDEPAAKGHSSIVAASGASRDPDAGFVGELKRIQLDNLIQLYCLSAETMAVKINQGDYSGTVYLEEGEIVHAESGSRSGEDAFYAIMALQGGRIETSQTEKAAQRTINQNYQFLLMEAARRSDENSWMEEETAPSVDIDVCASGLAVDAPILKALVVDDSKLMRKIIAGMLTAEGDIEVIGTAGDGREALRLLTELQPDFITLDANMPVMDGLTTLKHIMIKKPCPVIVMSNLAAGDQRTLTQFFTLGAVDFLPKPVKNKNMLAQQQQLLARARSAAGARISNFKRHGSSQTSELDGDAADAPGQACLVVLISGPGGYHEMLQVIAALPSQPKAYLTAFQSLPVEFTTHFAVAAGRQARVKTVALEGTRRLVPGCCYIASVESQVSFHTSDGAYAISPGAASYSRAGKTKNLDDFIASAIANFAGCVHAIFLSGAEGMDAASLAAVQKADGTVIVQEPATCMMPDFLETLVSRGIADRTVLPENLAREIVALVSNRPERMP
jgi:two-component system chemotaxis response regulator CheB